MVVNNLYQAKTDDVAASMEFSDDFIAQVLHDIYRRGKAQSPTDLSPELFRAILRRFNEATAQSMAAADVPDLETSVRRYAIPTRSSLPSRSTVCNLIWQDFSPIQTAI